MITTLLLYTLSFFIVSKILPGFRVKSFGTAFICAIVLAVVGAVLTVFAPLFVAPFILMMLASTAFGPLGVMVAMAVFVISAQAILLIIVDKLIEDFEIDSWGTAWLGAFLMFVIQFGLSFVTP